MPLLRAFFRRYPALGLLAVGMAMALHIVVPQGFMPTFDHGRVIVTICSGTGPMTAMMEMPDNSHEMPGKTDGHGNAAQTCPFAGLSMPLLAAAGAAVVEIALVFVMVVGSRPLMPLDPRRTPFLQPPSRGPPALG